MRLEFRVLENIKHERMIFGTGGIDFSVCFKFIVDDY